MRGPAIVAKGSIILGCGTFGGIGTPRELIGRGLTEDAAQQTLDEAVACGITMLDTAASYAAGASETIIGRWRGAQAEEVAATMKITTKVLPPSLSDHDGPFDEPYIARILAGSCERLGVEQVDLLLTHAPDDRTPVDVVVEALAALRGRGAHAVGACNVEASDLLAALDAADRIGVAGYDVVQNGYNLLVPDADREVRAICRERAIAYTPFSPLAGGVLTGKYERDQAPPEGTRLQLRPEGVDELLTPAVHDAIDRLRDAAAARDTSCGALALAWLLHHPDVAAPIVGPSRHAPHLAIARDATAVELSPNDHAEIAAWFRAATG